MVETTTQRHHEIHARTLIKTITWKVLASFLAFGSTYYITHDASVSGKLAGTTFVFGLILYYAHERVWNRIHWGKESREI